MFVIKNNLTEIKRYFKKELGHLYSENELKHIVKELTAKILIVSDSDFILSDTVSLSESDLLFYHKALKRMRAGEPSQYVIGSVEFAGIRIQTDRRALIPRPETEELVHWIASENVGVPQPVIYDLCAGTGCIGLALKSKLPQARVNLVELSEEACELIEQNRAATHLSAELFRADVLNPQFYKGISPASVDIIVSNPPYVCESERALMDDRVLQYEPGMALFVPDLDPIVFYESIAKGAQHLLKEGARIYFEIHENAGSAVVHLMEDLGFVNIELRKDLQGKDRMLRAKR